METTPDIISEWYNSGSVPSEPADGNFPNGSELDLSLGAEKTCSIDLQYPVNRKGYHKVNCHKCRLTKIVYTQGVASDPKSVKLKCNRLLPENAQTPG